jgi:dTDP-4-dehydrorhamnose 3,5-epimerase
VEASILAISNDNFRKDGVTLTKSDFLDGSHDLGVDDFINDPGWGEDLPMRSVSSDTFIEGVEIRPLQTRGDSRGSVTVFGSALGGQAFSAPHVYIVEAAAGSVRAWVYHKIQSDRLAFTNGAFRFVLFDLRKESATYGHLMVLDVGAENKVQLTIPPYVVHGVKNISLENAFFINMPTEPYRPSAPDKYRLPVDDPRISYDWG